MTLNKMRIQVGLWTYLIPFVLCWAIFRMFSWFIEPHHSLENSLYAYGIYLLLLAINIVTGFILARLGLNRAWWVRFLFAVTSLALFTPVVLILAPLGALIIYVADQKRATILWVIAFILNVTVFISVYLFVLHREDVSIFLFILVPVEIFTFWICSFKKEHIGSVVTSFLAPIAMFSLGLFVSQQGNIKAFREAKKGVLIMNHRGSADYFLAAYINMYKNWRVMIGANLWSMRFFHWFFNAVGVPIPRESEASEKRAQAVLISKEFISSNEDAILTIYAEGTRNRTEHPLLSLQNGAFKIACETGVPVYLAVIFDANKWRWPGEQTTKSYVKKKRFRLKSFLRSAADLIVRIFKTGINPTIVRIRYLDPIQTIGKTYEQIKEEAESVMKEAIIKYAKK